MQSVYVLQIGVGERLPAMTELRPAVASFSTAQLQQVADTQIAAKEGVQFSSTWSDSIWLCRKVVLKDGSCEWYMITTIPFVEEELNHAHS